ncbi:MAG: hypothetical protein L0Z62_10100 [Gemmataceae bacterium]|nr:hypothetical protein [Gemmataceae bacterium]
MRQPPTYLSWLITSHSPAEGRELQRRLAERISLDRIVTDTVHVFPNGVEHVQSVPHRLGDYFADIRMLSAPVETPAAFCLVFHRLPQAGRFWKDLMVNFLQEIQASPETLSVTLDSKGDAAPPEGVQLQAGP